MNNKKVPKRQCVGCRELKLKNEMIRVIKTPEDDITIDITGRKNGRGAYICRTPECLDKAVKNKGLERTLKTNIPKEIYEQMTKELIKLEQE